MKRLPKIVIMTMCALVFLMATGCDSKLQMVEGENSIVINGWELTSPDGIQAIRACTATKVLATKNEELGGCPYFLAIEGNAESVINRVSDPFFGKEYIDDDNPELQKYLSSMLAKNPESEGRYKITLKMSPIQGAELQNSRSCLSDYINVPRGAAPPYGLGTLGNWVTVFSYIPQGYRSTECACTLKVAPVWQRNLSKYSAVGSKSGIRYGYPATIKPEKFRIGWWNWSIQINGSTPGQVCIDVTW